MTPLKIVINETQPFQREVEMDFPIFRKHDMMADDYDSVYYYRIDADGTKRCVHYSKYPGGSLNYELSVEGMSMHPCAESADFMMGRSEYASSREEYVDVLYAAMELGRRMCP